MRLLLLAAAAAGLVLCAACSGTAVTAARLDGAVGPTFARLYAVQQHRLGRSVALRPDGVARCRRGNASSPLTGAGDDWSCAVNYPFADGHIQPITYDLHVQPGGCYTADGPAQVVGAQQQRSTFGTTVLNPLFEFDGCFAV